MRYAVYKTIDYNGDTIDHKYAANHDINSAHTFMNIYVEADRRYCDMQSQYEVREEK